ncbi:MAG: hypothetical protein M3R59_01410 [Verrucomicrobiota bacterium]|nr:hypothetical protein [Verrucomicrobiota bacterium]
MRRVLAASPLTRGAKNDRQDQIVHSDDNAAATAQAKQIFGRCHAKYRFVIAGALLE